MKTVVQPAYARQYPAVVSIHVPSPPDANHPFEKPRLWHSLHRNNLANLMAEAGFDQADYDLHGGGAGATIEFHSWDIDARAGKVPEGVQTYIEKQFGQDGWDFAKSIMVLVRTLLPGIALLFPAARPALIVAGTLVNLADDVVDALEGEDGE